VNAQLFRHNARTVLFMTAVTFVAITVIGLVDAATRETVQRNQTLFIKQAVAAAAGQESFDSMAALLLWYETAVTEPVPETAEPFVVRDPAGGARWVLRQEGPGLWGGITAYVGFDDSGAIRGVTFLDHVETPGLGARIDESWFRRQFVGKRGPFQALRPEPKDKTATSRDPQVFDQITGATITSTAVKEIMNRSIEQVRPLTARP
jgi:Na+-transporting NADH:ubiquinone oxidoreductase subunit C